MIAKLRLPDGSELVLGDDLRWTGGPPGMADRLNADREYSPLAHYSPAFGEPGHHHAAKVAKDFDAEIVYRAPLPEYPPGVRF